MSHQKNFLLILPAGLLILSACTTPGATTAVTATATSTPPPTATAIMVLPSPSSSGDSIIWDNLQVTMDRLEITEEYLTDFGSTRTPPAGKKFMWVHVRLKDIGQVQVNLPKLENFSILYAATEIKPIYGHRSGYTEYSTLNPVIFPDQDLEGWLRFDIPASALLNEMRFVFLPESAQVGVSYSSPNYPYADDKPTFVWDCGK